MSVLNRTTYQRLQKLPQLDSIWEGDRLPLRSQDGEPVNVQDSDELTDCIFWVDGLHGVVRAIEMVPESGGPELAVRALLRAMEQPMDTANNLAYPARPKKIVVRNRELQFFLRGVVQELDITVEYRPDLPLIDDIYGGMQNFLSHQAPQLPPEYDITLQQQAAQLWALRPWEDLADHQILQITWPQEDSEPLYVSVLGQLGVEYGFILYRSLDSLKQFRQTAANTDGDPEEAESAFLQQDCLYVTFVTHDDGPKVTTALPPVPMDDIRVEFGSIHPLEGLQVQLHTEEAAVLHVALEGLIRFLTQHQRALQADFVELQGRFRITPELTSLDDPDDPASSSSNTQGGKATRKSKAGKDKAKKTKSSKSTSQVIEVQSCPDLAAELLDFDTDDDDLGSLFFPVVKEDLIPDKAMVSIGQLQWETYDIIQEIRDIQYEPGPNPVARKADGFPILLIQTSAPKAKQMLKDIQAIEGIQGIGFNTGHDPLADMDYDLGLIRCGNGEMQLFGEYDRKSKIHQIARQNWDQRSEQTGGICGLLIAKGITGKARGNPGLREMVALIETEALPLDVLGLGPLSLQPLAGMF
ncbi:MAG: hypothetical protein AAGF24_14055 [Cyanobacteria bacterium P01_H01_bin.121]